MIENGFCWSETRNGEIFSTCSESELKGCQCPSGFKGDGQNCEDIDECKERTTCHCSCCHCKYKWGGYDCKSKGDHLYIVDQDTRIGRFSSIFGFFLAFLVLSGIVTIGTAGYVFYKYRFQIFYANVLDYHIITDALKGCSGLFYTFEHPQSVAGYDEVMAKIEVKAAHNALEARAQTETIEKVVFTSSMATTIWREDGDYNVNVVDERHWSDANMCKK